MDHILQYIAQSVRSAMQLPARFLDRISRGKITPNHVTLVSTIGHGTVLWALISNQPYLAAGCIAFFGLMDSLDGALARVQKRSSLTGMYFDAVSDRLKEVIIYTGLTVYLIQNDLQTSVWLATAVLGGSILVSYAKAKGEMAVAGTGSLKPQELNRAFADGVARYEVRMTLLIVGLLSQHIELALAVLLGLTAYTGAQRVWRLQKVLKKLDAHA